MPPPTGLPAALVSAPTMIRLVKALRRCWLRATVVGVIVAGAAAAVAWNVIPTSTHTARTLIRVPAVSTIIFPLKEAIPNQVDHQKTQVALAKSQLVLVAAMKKPGVSELSMLSTAKLKGKTPEEWLEKEVQADFSVAPEILRIAVTGENPAELKTLVKALGDAYKSEIVARERNERVGRLGLITRKRDDYAATLQNKRQTEKALVQQGVSKESTGRVLQQQFIQLQLASLQKDLLQIKSELNRNKAEFAIQQDLQKTLKTAVVTDAEIQTQLAAEPAIQAAVATVGHLAGLADEAKAKATQGEAAPAVQAWRRQQAEADAKLTALKKQMAPQIAERVKTLRGKAAAETIAALDLKIKAGEQADKSITTQIDDLQKSVQLMTDNNGKYDALKEETAVLEDFIKKLTDEEEKLRFEIDAPTRVIDLEEAVVQRAMDDKRLIMASTGVFLGTFAAVLLAFALHEFRARRVDTVEEVVHGLGMNLIGTIPDSTAAAAASGADDPAAHSTLAEAVDATRVMLLRAARQESLRVVMVTSAQSGEGKTSLSTHLAASMAQVGLNTLLIDGDLRNPVAHQVFDLEPAPGFCELLRGDVEAAAVIRNTPVDRLSMIPAGRWSTKASRALAQDDVAGRIIRQFREQFDFIIIDSSPVLPVVDPLLMGQLADGTILSVLRDVSRMPNVYAAHQRLIAGGVRVLGAVVNGVRGEAYGAIYPYRQRVG
jgi:capsular exopolysaccharide synthesis family protein